MGKLETSEEKVNFIVGIFRFYQPTLSLPEQIVLLTLWEESCVEKEEFEMAGAIKNEMDKIMKNPEKTPQRIKGDLDVTKLIKNNPLLIHNKKPIEVKKTKKEKPSIYKRIINKIKRVFKWRIK